METKVRTAVGTHTYSRTPSVADGYVEVLVGNEKKIKSMVTVEPVKEFSPKPVYEAIKRFSEFLLAFVGILLTLVPMMVIALIIKLDSSGPILYKQERLGKNGIPFHVLKFRSMQVDAEKNGACWASPNDERVTKFGRLIRDTRLDELPQLFCILSGSMSFVGPRPERPVFYDAFDRYIIGFRQRLLVKPGLTGLAQISGGYDLEPEEKIQYDMEYINQRALLLDIKIVLKTIPVIFNREGAR